MKFALQVQGSRSLEFGLPEARLLDTYFKLDLVFELVQRLGDGLVVLGENFGCRFFLYLVLLESNHKSK